MGLATALSMTGDLGGSIELCRRAIELDPSHLRAYGILGGVYQRLGQFDEAVACAQSAIAIRPDVSKPYVEIVRCKKIAAEDTELLNVLEQMLIDPKRPTSEKFQIAFALGKAFDELGEYDRARVSFELANDIACEMTGSSIRYDFGRREAEVETISKTFNTPVRPEPSRVEPLPVLIVGMIRSGTTLLDSLLCRYEGISSAGELRFWEDRITGGFRAGSPPKPSALAVEYRSILKETDPAARVVIDKMPMNHRFLGFILGALPEAKVIHLRRNPLDTCVSIYTTDFGPRPPNFAFERGRIAHAYRMYLRLMDHWRRLIPSEAMMEVDYEDLVGGTDKTLGAVLNFLGVSAGIGSEPGNLDIRTPSRWQARRPVYASSVGRWKNYQPWLKEFGPLVK